MRNDSLTTDGARCGSRTPPAAAAAKPASGTWVTGMNGATPPTGSMPVSESSQTHCLNGNTWLEPACGSDGALDAVVPAPSELTNIANERRNE